MACHGYTPPSHSGLADRCGAAQGNPSRGAQARPLRRILGIVFRRPATDGSETMAWCCVDPNRYGSDTPRSRQKGIVGPGPIPTNALHDDQSRCALRSTRSSAVPTPRDLAASKIFPNLKARLETACCNVAAITKSVDTRLVIRSINHRCFIVLSMLAVLGMVAVVPLGSTLAGEKVGVVTSDHSSGDTPCHKPVKSEQPCPDCPQKSCPDGAACMVKCFQQLSAVLPKALVFKIPASKTGVLAERFAPPLRSLSPPLRPPIV